MSFAKAIVGNSPRGVNIVTEVDFYYPMYSSISELFPKHKKPTPTTTAKPEIQPIPITPIPMIENPKFDSISGTYIDDTNFWRRKVS